MLSLVNPAQTPAWDAYVSAAAGASVYHRSAWVAAIAETYRYRPCCVIARRGEGGSVVGALPFLSVDSILTGRRLVALPFTTYADPLGTEWRMPDVLRFLARQCPGVRRVELKCLRRDVMPLEGGNGTSRYVTHLLDLAPGPDALFAAFHATSIRQRIRRAERERGEVRWVDAEEGVRDLYRMLVGVRRKHGLPPPPYPFFRNLFARLRPEGLVRVPVVVRDGRPVAAAMVVQFGDTVHLEYSASDERFLKAGVNQLLIWEAIRMACARKARFFDFGRSARADAPLIAFKERWGAKERPLQRFCFPPGNGHCAGHETLRRLLGGVNRRLPGRLLRWEGQLLYRHLG